MCNFLTLSDGGEKAERIWADKDGEKDKHFERSQRENEKLETNEKVKNGNNNEIRRCGRLEGKVARCIETHKRVEKVTEEKETKQEIEESIKLIGKPLSERKKDTWIKANPRAQPIPPKCSSSFCLHDSASLPRQTLFLNLAHPNDESKGCFDSTNVGKTVAECCSDCPTPLTLRS